MKSNAGKELTGESIPEMCVTMHIVGPASVLHECESSPPSSRLQLPNNKDFEIPAKMMGVFDYQRDTSRWKMVDVIPTPAKELEF